MILELEISTSSDLRFPIAATTASASASGEKRWREEVEVDSGGFHTPFF